MRAYMRGQVVGVPAFRLFGGLATQASPGTSVLMQPISPWFDVNNGFIDLTAIAEYAAHNTAVTAAPPGVHIRTVDLSVRYLRPCTVDDATVVARGRMLHGGSSVTTIDVLMEDPLGRAVGQASASVVFTPMDPPPPPLTRALEVAEEATYTTPDPPQRPLPARPPMHFAGGELTAMPPFADFLGVELSDVSEGHSQGTLPASPWFSRLHAAVAPGVMGAAADLIAGPAIAQTMDTESERLVIINSSHSFLRPVPTDGRLLTVTSSVSEREGDLFVVHSRIVDDRGQVVMVGYGPCMVKPRRSTAPRRSGERVLVTVLFTDLVGSTKHARALDIPRP